MPLSCSVSALCIAAAMIHGAPANETELRSLARLNFEFDATAPATTSAPWYEPRQEEPPPEDEPAPAFASKGSTRVYWHLGAAIDADESTNWLAQGGVGFERFVAKKLSLSLELNGMGISQQGPDAGAFNVVGMLRWYFYEREHWSMYIDAGAGVMMATNEVPNYSPEHGSNFNFTPQAGMGVSIALEGESRLMLGARWHHISNANTYEENSGRDSILGYVGLSLPF